MRGDIETAITLAQLGRLASSIEKEKQIDGNTLVNSSFSAIVNAPFEKIDIPTWCFSLTEAEYQSCSPAHVAAGVTTAPDGRRMSINVEILGEARWSSTIWKI